MKSTHFFLGANSAEGFYSLYDQLLDAGLYDLMILKGGPGCGKSTFMRRMAGALEEYGVETAYIHCSGDPDSLDAVVFPSIRRAVVDGTAPHVLEPQYMAARERYVDLSPCYDIARAKAAAEKIVACSDAYRASYREAYHVLRALGSVDEERRAIIRTEFDGEKLLRRAAGIAARELKAGGEDGRTEEVFLGGLTCKGQICRFDSAETLCPRVYVFCDSYGLAAPALRFLHAAAVQAGLNTIVCRDPLHPAELQHLLVPSRGVAFVTSCEGIAYDGKPYRRIRIDAMAEEHLSRAEKARLRFIRRVRRTLETETIGALARAKQEHDALEALYHPCVDFDGVNTLCALETARILRDMQMPA